MPAEYLLEYGLARDDAEAKFVIAEQDFEETLVEETIGELIAGYLEALEKLLEG